MDSERVKPTEVSREMQDRQDCAGKDRRNKKGAEIEAPLTN